MHGCKKNKRKRCCGKKCKKNKKSDIKFDKKLYKKFFKEISKQVKIINDLKEFKKNLLKY